MHAVRGLPYLVAEYPEPYKIEAMVVTLTRSDNFAQVSKPCAVCGPMLAAVGVQTVVCAERANDGSWLAQRLPTALLMDLKAPRLA
jgi:hypothetical protein